MSLSGAAWSSSWSLSGAALWSSMGVVGGGLVVGGAFVLGGPIVCTRMLRPKFVKRTGHGMERLQQRVGHMHGLAGAHRGLGCERGGWRCGHLRMHTTLSVSASMGLRSHACMGLGVRICPQEMRHGLA